MQQCLLTFSISEFFSLGHVLTSLELGDSEDSKALVHRTARTPCSYTLFTGRHVFYPRDAMLARVPATTLCLSVCLSVCHKSEFY